MNKTLLVILLAIGGVAFVILLACGGVIFYTVKNFKNFDSDVSPTVDRLFAQAAAGKFADTYATDTAPELQQITSREQYEHIGTLIETRLGGLKSKSLTNFYISQTNGQRTVDVTYTATFEKGTATVKAKFRKDGDRWLLVMINVNSPEFQKDLATVKCPHCGEPHAASAKFCPKCGKALDSTPTKEERAPKAEPQESN